MKTLKIATIFSILIVAIQPFSNAVADSNKVSNELTCFYADGSVDYDVCNDAEKALQSRKLVTLKKILIESQHRALVKFLRDNPGASSISEFVIDQSPSQFVAQCCQCEIGINCNAHIAFACDFPKEDGTCPTGTFRAICSVVGDDEVECKSVED